MGGGKRAKDYKVRKLNEKDEKYVEMEKLKNINDNKTKKTKENNI